MQYHHHHQTAKLLYFLALIGGRQRPLIRIMSICFTYLRVVGPLYTKLETISLFLPPLIMIQPQTSYRPYFGINGVNCQVKINR